MPDKDAGSPLFGGGLLAEKKPLGFEGLANPLKLMCQDPCPEYYSPRHGERFDMSGIGFQEFSKEIGADQVIPHPGANRRLGHIRPRERDSIRDMIRPRIGAGNAHCHRIKIDRADRAAPEFRRGNGKNARSTPQVHHRTSCFCFPKGCNLIKAESGGRMMSGPETEPRIENYFKGVPGRLASDPTWFDEECSSREKGSKMPFPGFGPILSLELENPNCRDSSKDIGRLKDAEGGGEPGSCLATVRPLFQID